MTEAALDAGPRTGTRDFPAAPRRQAGMRLPRTALPSVLAVMAIGVVTGLGGTWFATSTGAGFNALRAGPWVSYPRNGAIDADPYARAVVARSGEIPLGLGEGLAFTAGRDSTGQPLVGSCSYRVVGRLPPTRYWTVTVHGADGSLIHNEAGRFGFTSGELVRRADGLVTIAVSRDVRPGNWLPTGTDRRFQLVLRLYDTPVSGTANALDAASLPRIERERCS
jgi:hypothetical protein